MDIIDNEKTLLAYFDVQAYSHFIQEHSYAECIRITEDLMAKIKRDAGSFIFDIGFKHWIFSDSIIIVPDTASRPLGLEAIDLLFAVSSSILVRGLVSGLPMRGAIGGGSFYKNGDVIVSTALIDAVKHEKEQNWLGAAVTPAALEIVKAMCPTFEIDFPERHNFGRFVRRGAIPWKPGLRDYVSQNTSGFYIKPVMDDPNWRRYLPHYFKQDGKITESDCLYIGQ